MKSSSSSSLVSKNSSVAVEARNREIRNKETLNVAIVGFGTVGSSVAKILSAHPASGLRLTHIYNRGIARKKTDSLPKHIQWTEDINDVLSPDVDILVELIGGLAPAGDWIRTALKAG